MVVWKEVVLREQCVCAAPSDAYNKDIHSEYRSA